MGTSKSVLYLTLVLGLSGCAIKTPHLSISQWPVEKRASYFSDPSPYRLIVTPLVDRRPQVEHQGQRPSGKFFLLWNKRVGDYYTSDRIFGERVNTQLADRLVAHIRASNAFQDVSLYQGEDNAINPEDAAQLKYIGQKQGGHFVLAGELEHFYGSQRQQFSMLVLPLYFINSYSWQNSKGLPWGKTAANFYLCDARNGDIVWRHRLEASSTLPRDEDSMAQAALESFTKLSEQLTSELRRLPLDKLPDSEATN